MISIFWSCFVSKFFDLQVPFGFFSNGSSGVFAEILQGTALPRPLGRFPAVGSGDLQLRHLRCFGGGATEWTWHILQPTIFGLIMGRW